MLGLIGNAIGGVIGAISGGSQKKKEQEQADRNFDFQKEQFEYQKQLNDRQFNFNKEQYEYQKELNNLQMEREDNAVQRRASDLEKAGLSKTLAAGSSASAGGMSAGSSMGSQSSAPAPQRSITGSTIASAINESVSTAKTFGDIMHLNTQNQLGQKDIEVKEVEKENIQADTQVKKQDEAVKRADAILKDKEATNYEKKLAQEIKESNAKILNMEVQNELNRQETINKKHNWNTAKIYGLPVGVAPNQSKLGAIGNDLVRSIYGTLGISDVVEDAYYKNNKNKSPKFYKPHNKKENLDKNLSKEQRNNYSSYRNKFLNNYKGY